MPFHLGAVRKVRGHHVLLRGVVVQRANVGGHLLPAIVAGAQARAVGRLGQVIEHAARRLLAPVGVDVAHAPALVERNPADDRRMVEVALDEAEHRLRQIAHRVVGIVVRAGHLAPDQHAHFVRPVVVARILELLVLARAVVAKVQRVLKIQADRLVARRGDQAVRPVALVKNQPLIQRIVVEVNLAFLHLDFAHAEVGIHGIHRGALLQDADPEVIQVRGARLPDVHRVEVGLHDQVDRHAGDAVLAADGHPALELALEGDGQLQIQRANRALVQRDLRREHVVVDVGGDVDVLDADLSHGLQVHSLPNAGDRRVPAAHQTLGPVLLAARLRAVRLVDHAKAQVIFAVLEQRGDVKGERRVAAPVRAGLPAVDVHGAFKVHRAKAQQHALARHLLRDGEAAAVPDHRVDGVRRAEAGGPGLVRKRHGDLQRQLVAGIHPSGTEALVGVVKGKLPDAVEVAEGFADKVRARMLRTRNIEDIFGSHNSPSRIIGMNEVKRAQVFQDYWNIRQTRYIKIVGYLRRARQILQKRRGSVDTLSISTTVSSCQAFCNCSIKPEGSSQITPSFL